MVNRPIVDESPASPPEEDPPARAARAVEAPAATPFHQLARTPLHRWWRPLVGTAVLLAVLFGISALAAYAGLLVFGALGYGGLELPVFGLPVTLSTIGFAIYLAAAGLAIPPVLLCVRLVQRRPVGSVSSVAGRLRWRWLLACVGLALAAYALKFALQYGLAALTGGPAPLPTWWIGWQAFLPPMLVIVVLTPLQATAEEYLFRGWLLQAIGSCTLGTATGRIARMLSRVLRTPWPAIVLTSVAFTLVHDYTGLGRLDVLVLGAAMAWLAVRTGGLEASIAWHTVNNVVVFGVYAAMAELGSMEQGDMSWQVVVADSAAMGIFAAAVVPLARRRRSSG